MAARASNEPLNYLALGFQSAKDVEATTFFFLKHLDGSGFDSEPDIQSHREGGDGQEVGFRHKQSIKTGGNLNAFSRPEHSGRLAAGVLGADVASVVTPSGAAQALVFHRQSYAPTIPYGTIDQRWADEVDRAVNVKLTTLEIEWEGGNNPISVRSPDFVVGGSAYSRDIASALTPTRETLPPHMYGGASLVLDGAGNTQVTKGKITVKRAVDADIRTTGLNAEDVVESAYDVDIDLTLKYQDRTLWRKVHNNGGSQISLDLATGALSLNSGNAGSYPFRVAIPFFDYVGAKVNRLDPDGKTMYVDVAGMTKKTATTTIFTENFSGASAAYV